VTRALALVALLAATAWGETPLARPEAIEVDRDAPPPGRVELGFDGGAPLDGLAVGAQVGYVSDPITVRTSALTVHPVHRRETIALGGALGLGSIVVDVRIPVAHQVGTRLAGLGDDHPLDRWVLGDVALGVRLGVAERGALHAFVRGELTLPSGDDDSFAGAASWTGAIQLIARASLPGVVLAATGGIRLRGSEVQVADRVVGNELFGGVGAVVGLPPVWGLWCKADQLGVAGELVGVLGDKLGGQRGPSPVEARLAVIGHPLPELAIGVRAGLGLNDQIGAPQLRAMLEVAWTALPALVRRAPPAAEPEPDLDEL
jgi:hypothetical protein